MQLKTQGMLESHPSVEDGASTALVACIDACLACAQACTSCADACLAEPTVEELRQCIRLDLDCADICAITACVVSRRTGSNADVLRKLLEAADTAAGACAVECRRHAIKHEHCRICAEACDACGRACRRAIMTIQ